MTEKITVIKGLLCSPICLLFLLHVKTSDFFPVESSSGDGSRLETKSVFWVGHGFR